MKITWSFDTKAGTMKSSARPESISEANTAAAVSAATNLSVSILHRAAAESVSGPEAASESLKIFIPRFVDPELGADEFDEVELGLADSPRSLYDSPAPWLVDVMRTAYGTHYAWKNVGTEYAVEGKEFRDRKGNVVQDILSDVETALFIFENTHGPNGRFSERFLDGYCGWVNHDKRGVMLVTDLYELSETTLAAVQNFCFETGLKFAVDGTSRKHPSKTVRLSIWKE